MRAVQVGTMYSSITLIHSSALSFRPGSTKCNEGAVSQAPMMPGTITSRVVSVCDAVNRSGVSSSSSASIFEVLRDSQIFGCGTLEKCRKMRRKLVSTFNRRLRERHAPRHLRDMAQPEKGLVRPDDVAELHFWSSWRLLANASSPM